MGSHSYLVNLDTNIGDLNTSGLLNSHANRFTTTNVGHMHGDQTSVISLGLEELIFDNLKRHTIVDGPHCEQARHDYYSCIGKGCDAGMTASQAAKNMDGCCTLWISGHHAPGTLNCVKGLFM